MLTPDQEKFLQYWEANREKEKKLLRQARAGLPLGLTFAAGILICVFSGWYKRAMMELSTEVSPILLIFAVFLIAITYAIFSQRQKWEMNEQSYLEIKAKLRREQIKTENQPVTQHLPVSGESDLAAGSTTRPKSDQIPEGEN